MGTGGDGDSSSASTTSGGDGDSTASTTTDTSGGDGDSTTGDTSGGDGDSTTSTATDTSGGDGDSTGSTTSSTSGGDGDGGNSDGCASGFTCTKALPLNWQGPVILNEAASNPASCGGGYPTQIDLKNKDLNFSEAECGCVCGSFATNVTCKGEMHVVDNTSCSGLEPSPAEITSGLCQYATVSNGQSLQVLDTYVYSGTCTAASTENIPDYTWDSQGRVCEATGSAWDTCEGTATDVCVPDTDRVCVYRTGAHSCPMWYPYKHELWETAVDTRDCGSCTCVANEDCHTSDVWVYPGAANLCNTPQWDTLTPESECHNPGSAEVDSVYWEAPTLGCGVSVPSQPSGTVGEQGAATVCCNAP